MGGGRSVMCRAWKKSQYETQIWGEILCIVVQSNSSFGQNVCLHSNNTYVLISVSPFQVLSLGPHKSSIL